MTQDNRLEGINMSKALSDVASNSDSSVTSPYQGRNERRRVMGRHAINICLTLFLLGVANQVFAQSACLTWANSYGGPSFTSASNACTNNDSPPGNGTYPITGGTVTNTYLVGGVLSGSLAAGNVSYACNLTEVFMTSPPGISWIGDEAQATLVPIYPPPSSCGYAVQAANPLQNESCSTNCVSDPINPGVGNVYEREKDGGFVGLESAIAFERFYNSADVSGADMAPGWRHSYGRSIVANYQVTVPTVYVGGAGVSSQFATAAAACAQGFLQIQAQINGWQSATANYTGNVCVVTSAAGSVLGTLQILSPYAQVATNPIEYDVIRDDGQILRYYSPSPGMINNPPGISLRLAQTSSGFTLTDDNDNVETYNANGVLQSISNRAGLLQTLSYTSGGLLRSVIGSFGHSFTVYRNAALQITSVTFSGGGTVQYGYDNLTRLVSVTNLDGTTRSYQYNDASFSNALSLLIDENGTQFSSWGYDQFERVTSTQEAPQLASSNINLMQLTYNANGTVTTTDALGAARTFGYTRVGDINKVASINGSQCPTCQESAATTYDNAGWVASRTDYNGNLTCYANDAVRGLELFRVEGFAPGSTCPANLASYTPQSGTLQRMISTIWNATWRLPSKIAEPTRSTSFSYDGSGNLLTKAVTDTTVTPNVTRTWTYTYGGYGRALTADGPRTDVLDKTTYQYYTCATGAQCGEIETVTDAAGHVTTYNTYNSYGQPLTITDPNGVVTTLTYDSRQRLKSRQVGTGASAETTGFQYYPTGLLQTVTQPDNSTVSYIYDAAHRLTQITDGAGNYIQYTLDALGHRTAENSYDSAGALHRTHTRTFNSNSTLYQDINAAGTSAVTTTYGYDANENQTAINAPLSRNTINAYDALNRLNQITDPYGVNTNIAYDAADDLTSLTDPRSLTTSYRYNGFGQVNSQASPDTGTTTNTYDSGGNLSTSTDARGAVATYTYDVLNRPTSASYKVGTTTDQTISFTYDSQVNGNDGIGRLTAASDANHTMSWTYDALGRVIGKSQIVSGVTRTVGYGYSNADLVTIVTPAQHTLTYVYNSNHQVTSIMFNGSTTILKNVTYEPLGPVNGWTWGNAATVTRSYNTDGNIAQINATGVKTITYDDALRILAISDTSAGASNWGYGYDLRDDLMTAIGGGITLNWVYDANGNRNGQVSPGVQTTYTISPTSNLIASISSPLSRTYTYDAAGNVLTYSTVTATYYDRGRLKTLGNGSTTETLIYNALGQMIQTSGGAAGTVLYMYDESGHLIGEYNGSGNLIEETVWLGDIPVATVQPNGSGLAIYDIETDHLNTPRQITAATAANTQMWTWFSDPFGTTAPNTNPAGAGSFVYNLRFPGQIYDPQAGLQQNYFRDYDPAVGRYVESDPIGLASGSMSTYSYALRDPVSYEDPTGRFVGVPPTVLNPTSAAATLSFYAGYGIGTLIYNAFSTQIQDALEDLVPYPSISPNPNNSPSVPSAAASANANACPPNDDDCKDRLSNYYIQQLGLDPHEIKRGILGREAPISRYELCKCADGRIVIRNKGCSGPIIETGEKM
jgi:RHS repeat-associated protein